MTDLTSLDGLAGDDLTEAQIQALLAQIDLDIANLLREGKLAALKYAGGHNLPGADRAANLAALLAARKHYAELLRALPAWEMSQGRWERETDR
uniref:Uncharacterized protein n=1 Tax=Schlesneria paludicola TaxID=360056 RepID=A0A7C4QV02_9PLAN